MPKARSPLNMLLKRYCRIGSRSFPDSFPPQSFRRRTFPRREGFVTTLLINADKCRRMEGWPSHGQAVHGFCGTRNNRIEFPSATLRKLKFRGCRRFLAATGQSFEVLVRDLCRVEVWRGGLGGTYLLPTLSVAGASLFPPCFRFHTPLIEPDMQIYRIRLSEKTHAIAEAIACDAVCNF